MFGKQFFRHIAKTLAGRVICNSWLGGTTPTIDDAIVERFGRTLADRIRKGDAALRRTWVRLFVDRVTVSNDEIVISGTKRALEAALVHGEKPGIPVVPSFDLKWCRLGDSNT